MTLDCLGAIYKIVDGSEKGLMPKQTLSLLGPEWYGARTVGYNRQYAANAVSQNVDELVRIWRNKSVRTGYVFVDEDGEQYRIDVIQHVKDQDGLECTDLTLSRLETYYEIAAE